jgi:hypothetical protein
MSYGGCVVINTLFLLIPILPLPFFFCGWCDFGLGWPPTPLLHQRQMHYAIMPLATKRIRVFPDDCRAAPQLLWKMPWHRYTEAFKIIEFILLRLAALAPHR